MLVLLGVVLLAGCTESQAYKNYRDEVDDWPWWKQIDVTCQDLLLDVLDIASLEFGGGECIGVTVMPTEFFQTGFFFGNTMKLGYRDRALGYYQESRREGGFSFFYYRDFSMDPIVGTPSLFDAEHRERLVQGFPIRSNKEWHWGDLGFEVGLIFFNMSAHVSPKETLDLAVSAVTFPFDLTLRPILSVCGVRIPELDI